MINPLLALYMDSLTWWAIHWYFAPYASIGNNDMEKFMKQVNLNGIRSASICQ